ncbi:hypothetical protein WISP_84866 [Willisornis vidua]|uniref:Uncharacterized protein n=1 Tax=Willisornis vidua TaxID=1566151 RepID=A0ABQ9D9B4_9PASS|nr:hypothetical protein WISP_84866 [Willisornis vidua]
MEDHHLPKIVLYSELATGCHKRGAPKRRYKDSLKQFLSLDHIDCHERSTLASNQYSWRHTIHNAIPSFQNTCRISFEEKRQCRILPKENFHCAFCNWTCPSRIGLFTSTLAASMGRALPKSLFMKPSHDDDDDDEM